MNALEGRVDLTFSQIDAILRTQCDVQLMNPSSWTRIIKAVRTPPPPRTRLISICVA